MQRQRVWAAAGVAVTAVVVLSLLAFGGGSGRENGRATAPLPAQVGIDSDKPCGGHGGASTSLSSAARTVPLQVPDHPLANSQNIRDVATCGLDGATLVFESGIQVQVDRSEITDPAKYFALLVSDEPARTTVGEMKGRVAAFDDPDALGGDRGKMGFVWFVLDGWNVVVKGLGNASLAELKEIAESLHPYQAPSGETS